MPALQDTLAATTTGLPVPLCIRQARDVPNASAMFAELQVGLEHQDILHVSSLFRYCNSVPDQQCKLVGVQHTGSCVKARQHTCA